MSFYIKLLGGIQVINVDSNQSLNRFRTRRASLLLSYLALQPGKEFAREELCEMLWPEEDPELQRTRLRYELSTLRRMLGQDSFVSGNHSFVALASSVASDVAEFNQSINQARYARTAEKRIPSLRKAIEIYQGELLPGLYLPEGTMPEGDWLTTEREDLRNKYKDSLLHLEQDLNTLGLAEEAKNIRAVRNRYFPESTEVQANSSNSSIGKDSSFLSQIRSTPEVSFYGREEEVNWLQKWATDLHNSNTRLVTITGPGGIGKTRLAIESIAGRIDASIVFLSGITNSELIYEAIHSALHLPHYAHVSIKQQLFESLRIRDPFILLLDNFEQLVETGKHLITELLEKCPRLRCIVTSRRPLMLPDEHEMLVPSLTEEASLHLFLFKARLCRIDFAQSEVGLHLSHDIVRKLEGIPLAIEIAAARVVILGPEQISEQLSRQLRFLVRLQPDMDPRHRSMRATLDWSARLLSKQARQTLATMSVFRAATPLSAIKAVCGDGDSPLIDLLEELRLNSLISISFYEEEAYYDLLSVVREYATDLLEQKDVLEVYMRYALYWTYEAKRIQTAFRSGNALTAKNRIRQDLSNIRGAIEGCFFLGASDSLYLILDGVAATLFEMGFWDDLDNMLDYTLRASISPAQEARLLDLKGALSRRRGDEKAAHAAWTRQLEIYRTVGTPDALVDVLFDLAGQSVDVGNLDMARKYLHEGRDIAIREDLRNRIVVAYVIDARIFFRSGQIEPALSQADNALCYLPNVPFNPTVVLYVYIHLLPIFRDQHHQKTVVFLLQEGFRTAYAAEQWFLLSRITDELAPFCDENGLYDEAFLAYTISYKVHNELSTRLAQPSSNALNTFLGKQKVRGRLSILDDKDVAESSWQSIAKCLLNEFPNILDSIEKLPSRENTMS